MFSVHWVIIDLQWRVAFKPGNRRPAYLRISDVELVKRRDVFDFVECPIRDLGKAQVEKLKSHALEVFYCRVVNGENLRGIEIEDSSMRKFPLARFPLCSDRLPRQ